MRTLIEDQFKGKLAYVTICKNCKNKSVNECEYYELELNIKVSTLLRDMHKRQEENDNLLGVQNPRRCNEKLCPGGGNDWLKSISFSMQEINGKNTSTLKVATYFCSKCSSLQDGARHIALRTLPRVLSMQLLRFVYDMQTFTKKKVRDTITFPMSIDFRPFVEPKSEEKEKIGNGESSAKENDNYEKNESGAREKEKEDKGNTDNDVIMGNVTQNSNIRSTRSQTKKSGIYNTNNLDNSNTNNSNSDEYVYELTSVMMHRGMSAYGGHYVVHVKDERYDYAMSIIEKYHLMIYFFAALENGGNSTTKM